jgi:arylformamidase
LLYCFLIMRIRDITTPIRDGLPTWPGEPGPRFRLTASHADGDVAEITHIQMGAHTGTHLDAPRHFIPNGGLVTGLDLDVLIGPAHVVHYRGDGPIPAAFFEEQDLPEGPLPRLLLRCDRNAGALLGDTFFEGYAGITPDAAEWMVSRGVRLIGTDYLSIGAYRGDYYVPVHLTLLGAEVIIVEGLDLRDVEPGPHTLICLPIALPADGAPCRAVLLPPGALPDPLSTQNGDPS